MVYFVLIVNNVIELGLYVGDARTSKVRGGNISSASVSSDTVVVDKEGDGKYPVTLRKKVNP